MQLIYQIALHGPTDISYLWVGLYFGKAFPISLYSLSLVIVLQGRLHISLWGS